MPTKATVVFDRNPALTTPVWSNEIDANVPTATVTALPAKSAPGTLHVRWKGSDGDGSGVASYDVYVSVDGGPLTLWKGDTTLTTATYPVTAGHAYGFAVRATNHVGTSGAVPSVAQTTTSVVATTATVPAKPAPPTAVGENGAAKVSWSAPADGGSPITGYVVTSSPTHRTCTTSGATSCTVTGLKNGTSYTFVVVASNAKGTSPASTPSGPVTPAGVPAAPAPPAAAPGNQAASVSWSAPTDQGSPITSYTVTSSPTNRTCTVSAGPLTCTVTGLTDGTVYSFTVVATNGVGPSSTVRPLVPGHAVRHRVRPGGLGRRGLRLRRSGAGGGFFGSLPALKVVPNKPMVGMVPTVTDRATSWWLRRRGVQPSATPPSWARCPGIKVTPNPPIVGIVAADTDRATSWSGRTAGSTPSAQFPSWAPCPARASRWTTSSASPPPPRATATGWSQATGTVYAFGTAQAFGHHGHHIAGHRHRRHSHRRGLLAGRRPDGSRLPLRQRRQGRSAHCRPTGHAGPPGHRHRPHGRDNRLLAARLRRRHLRLRDSPLRRQPPGRRGPRHQHRGGGAELSIGGQQPEVRLPRRLR